MTLVWIYSAFICLLICNVNRCNGASKVNNNYSVQDINKDGFNIYKDFLRGKTEDSSELLDELLGDDTSGSNMISKILYFYRTPLATEKEIHDIGDILTKRTVNKFKNMMLYKDIGKQDSEEEFASKEAPRFYIPRAKSKRDPGAILSWAIPAANRVRIVNTNYRPPGFTRPAA